MENLDKETQMIAVKKVLEEMKMAEDFINNWKVAWWETYENAVLPHEYFEWMFLMEDARKLDKEAIKIDENTATEDYRGIPLKHITIGGKYSCDVSSIIWSGILTKQSTRDIEFHNTGNISLKKFPNKAPTKTHQKTISYEALYNVLSNDFNINFTLKESILGNAWKKIDFMSINLCQNILTEKINDIEITKDLNTGMKLVRIVKKYDKRNRQSNASIAFEATLNPDDSLEMGAVAINTHKSNGKVNGTYRFDVSRKKGVRANFYSRKGVKVDLATNPMLLETANNLLLPAPSNQNSGDIIVSNFTNSTQNAITKNLSERVISFDSSDFNMETVKQAETKIIEMLKTIKGELPLTGLVERIDNCLELINKVHKFQEIDENKTLELESSD